MNTLLALLLSITLVFALTGGVFAEDGVEDTTTIGPTEAQATKPGKAAREKRLKETINMHKDEQKREKTGKLRKEAGKKNRAYLLGAEVTAVSDSSLSVSKDGKTYTVNAGEDTKVRRHYFGKSSLTEFSVGNKVNVRGVWADDSQTTIAAHMIRNLSIMKKHGTFFGTVKSTSTNSFVLTSRHRGVQTVTTDTNTKFVNRRQQTITIVDILVGHKVRVKGLWDMSQKTVTQVTQVKDFSIPAQTTTPGSPTFTPTPTVTPTE